MINKVLIIENDIALCKSLTQMIELAGLAPLPMASFVQARRSIRADFNGVILTDIRMPRQDGFDVLSFAQNVDSDLPVILLTGHSDVPTALRAMKSGAYDYLEKPCSTDQMVEVLERALEHRALVLKSRKIQRVLMRSDVAAIEFPGESSATATLRDTLRSVAHANMPVHLCGPDGVGKRTAAHTINRLAETARPFVQINFSGAADTAVSIPGVPEKPFDLLAKFIDLATPDQQRQLIGLIQSNPQMRLITSSTRALADIRNNMVVDELVAMDGVAEITVPSLNERREDLLDIFETILHQTANRLNAEIPELHFGLVSDIMARSWAGNLPQMRTYATSILLGGKLCNAPGDSPTLAEQMDAFERLVLSETLKQCNGSASESAKLLGMPRNTFYDRISRHGITPKHFRNKNAR
ncbi:sigma-54-dependent transcriptional regulator [Sedimentitalea sp. HM32M-2]|uniref:sigma-54-dependent transcriptional regulator n=1 Tax=Sedimentitalea sp. HM32M-2 TaxID=3351566 RepID=UPI0036268BE5